MVEPLLVLTVFVGFFVSFLVTPVWIKKMKEIGYMWKDMNKPNKPENVASSGGIVVVLAFILGSLYYIFVRTFVLNSGNGVSLEIFASLSVLLILALIGFIDDFLDWEKGGLSTKTRLILALFASVPLVVINAGDSSMAVPLLGTIELGLLYPLVFIPLGITGVATTYNFLAGFNGLETGQGIIILSFLSLVAHLTGSSWLAVVGLTMVAALLGFYFYNYNPAKVFPGDSLTWGVGALIAIMAILGDFEKIAAIVFIPYIIEVFLKLRGKLDKQSFGKPNDDGSLELKYGKIYGLTHFGIWSLKKLKPSKKVYETEVVMFIHGIQAVFIILAAIFWLL